MPDSQTLGLLVAAMVAGIICFRLFTVLGRKTGHEPPPTFVQLHDARIAASSLHGRQAEITVAFTAEFASGNVSDVWTFERNLDSSDPNWVLVATSGDAPA